MGISVAAISTMAWETGQATVGPHSLELAASARRTLSNISRLTTVDRSRVGLKASGDSAGARLFGFSFFANFGTMSTGEN